MPPDRTQPPRETPLADTTPPSGQKHRGTGGPAAEAEMPQRPAPDTLARAKARRLAAVETPGPDIGGARGFLAARVFELVDLEPSHIHSDQDRLARVMSLVGEIADAYLYGHKDIDAEVQRAAAALMAWAESNAHRGAA